MRLAGAELQALLAEGHLREAIERLEAEPNPSAEHLLRKGRVLTMMGRLEQAIAVVQEAAEAARANPELRAECLIEAATAYSRRGDREAHEQATELLNEAETLTSEPRLRGLGELARAALALKQDGHAEALPLLLRARTALEPFAAEHVRALDATGACWAALGDTVRARAFIEHAIQKKSELGDIYGLAISYGQLGRLYLRLNELHSAERAFAKDLELCERMEDQRGEAQCLNHLAQVALGYGNTAKARQLLARAKELTAPEGIAFALLLKDEAQLLAAEGKMVEAARAGDDAALILSRFDNRYAYALLDHVRGNIALAQGKTEEGGNLLRAALATMTEVEARLERIPVLVDLAEHYRQTDRHEAFVTVLSQAFELAEASRADTWVMELEHMLETADPTRWLEKVLVKLQGLRPGTPVSARPDYALKAESRFVVVIFSDIVGFTAWSAQREATEVVETLNDYFGRMATAVQDNGGVIDKYIGDGLMVVFADDEAPERLVARGCSCALDMLAQLEAWNQDRRLTERATVRMRIGINAGEAVVGNMGSYLKVARSAVGRAVNLAARLESLGEPDRVLCSSRVHELAQRDFVFLERGLVQPKGLDPEHAYWLEARRQSTV